MDVKKNSGITVVVPTYNRACYIRACVESVLSQDVEGLKLVVVDDASTDDTISILNEIKLKDSRLEIVQHTKNTGSMNKAMSDAILACDTKYFTWIGSDDLYVRHDALSLVVSEHEKQNDTDYISFDLKFFHGEDVNSICNLCGSVWPKELGLYSADKKEAYSPITYAYCVYMSFCPPFPWNGVWKTSFFKRHDITWISYMDNVWSPDTINGLYFFSKGMKAQHLVNTPLVYYRKHKGQDTVSRYASQKLRSDITLLYALYEWFNPEDFTTKKFKSQEEKHIRLLSDILAQMEKVHPEDISRDILEDCAVDALTFMWSRLRNNLQELNVKCLEKAFMRFINKYDRRS